MTRPSASSGRTRHPVGEPVHFRELPFDLGIVHYASDTPYTRARTLGGRGLSFVGIDATYAAMIAIVRRTPAQSAFRERVARDPGAPPAAEAAG